MLCFVIFFMVLNIALWVHVQVRASHSAVRPNYCPSHHVWLCLRFIARMWKPCLSRWGVNESGGGGGGGSLILQREGITHLKAVRVRLYPACFPCWTGLPQQGRVYFREIGRGNKKSEGAQTQKGKSNPLITLIWGLALLKFEVVRPCGECRGGLCADSGFRSLLSAALRINERAGKKENERKRKPPREQGDKQTWSLSVLVAKQ